MIELFWVATGMFALGVLCGGIIFAVAWKINRSIDHDLKINELKKIRRKTKLANDLRDAANERLQRQKHS